MNNFRTIAQFSQFCINPQITPGFEEDKLDDSIMGVSWVVFKIFLHSLYEYSPIPRDIYFLVPRKESLEPTEHFLSIINAVNFSMKLSD